MKKAKMIDQKHVGRFKTSTIVIGVVLLSIYFTINWFRACEYPLNSDMANMVLEAEDILKGNVFLDDWVLTGITFVTTDLVYFVVAVLFFGPTAKAFSFALALMIFVLVLSSFLLLNKEDKISAFVGISFLMGLGMFYNMSSRGFLMVHTACFSLVFVSIYFFNRYIRSKKMKDGIISIATLALAVCGDSLAIIFACVPMLILAFTTLFLWNEKNEDEKHRAYALIKLSVLGLVAGKMLEKIWLLGGADKNSYIGNKNFVGWEQLPDKIGLFLQGVFTLLDADYTNKTISNVLALASFARAIIVIVGLAITVIEIRNFITKKEIDYINTILSVGLWTVAIVYITTDISVDVATTRYFNFTACLLAIVCSRYIANRKLASYKLIAGGIIMMILSVVQIFPVNFNSKMYTLSSVQEQLIETIETNGLENGYATFWNASVLTVGSGGSVKVRHIISGGDYIYPMNWFCKKSWYTEPANFIILDTNADATYDNSISKDMLQIQFGAPANILTVENYEILVYDYDISYR